MVVAENTPGLVLIGSGEALWAILEPARSPGRTRLTGQAGPHARAGTGGLELAVLEAFGPSASEQSPQGIPEHPQRKGGRVDAGQAGASTSRLLKSVEVVHVLYILLSFCFCPRH